MLHIRKIEFIVDINFKCYIILKESIRFRAVKKEQLIQKINCSECDSFQLYQFAETLAVIYMGIVSSLKLKRTQKTAKT